MTAETWHASGRFVRMYPPGPTRPPHARAVSCHDEGDAARIARLPLLESLVRELAESLAAHVTADAKREGVAPAIVCPCASDVLARAAKVLS